MIILEPVCTQTVNCNQSIEGAEWMHGYLQLTITVES